MRNRLIALGVGIALLLFVGLPLAYLTWPAPVPVSAGGADLQVRYQLRSAQSQSVTEQSFAGKWQLVVFGFTHCPDICPTTLSTVGQVMDNLGEQASQLQPLFITLDPQRDTPARLAEYSRFFDPRILGLSGSPMQVRDAASAFGVYFRKVPMDTGYTLDHTTTLFLVSPQGTVQQVFSHSEPAGSITRAVKALLDAR
ncbi:MAG: SCO family protein [Halopseudomonas sp.]|uniref:SCO family protein n=1 Tax=Halopseudomonas sp. TaxID=2901191 RepID=UPI0030010C1C